MRNHHPLYQSFLETVRGKVTDSLDLFKAPEFWQELDEDEKKELSLLFLKRAEEALEEKNEEKLAESSKLAEEISNDRHDVLVGVSGLLYRQGVVANDKEALLLALGKLVQIEEKNPIYFQTDGKASQLWGNLLVALQRFTQDDSFLEQAIQKYEQAKVCVEKNNAKTLGEIHWDLGEAYQLLGRRSNELADLKKSEVHFAQAEQFGVGTPHFWIDYATTLFHLGIYLGEPEYLHKANQFYSEVISKESNKSAYLRAWVLYPLSAQKIAELTHSDRDFQNADRIFQEAIMANPGEAALWLHWGELFLQFGWYKKDLNYLDKGLEKLTSLKTNECDPLSLAALLSSGLALLGLSIEDLRLIKEGEKRVQMALDDGHQSLELLYAAGICAHAKGCYFNDAEALSTALSYFDKVIEHDSTALFARHLIFECGMALADLKSENHYARKSIDAIARAAKLAPKVPLFWNEWAISLVKWHVLEKKPTLLLEQAVEKFKIALSLDEENPDPRGLFHYAIALDLLGAIGEDEKSYEKAIALLEEVQEKIPDSFTVRYQLALTYFHLGELTGEVANLYHAIDLFESIVNVDREDDGSWCGLGCALLTLSEEIADPIHMEQSQEYKTRAEIALLKAAEWGNLEVHYHLACLYSLKGQLEKSIEYLVKANNLHTLPTYDEMLEDEWLENVKETKEFRQLFTGERG